MADSVNKIFTIVSPFLSFLDFEILEDIINNEDIGADSDRQNLAEYIRSLKAFLNLWKVDPQKVCCDESELSRSRAKLCFKLDTDSLALYRDVKAAIARVLGVQVYALQLYSIEDGCIELVFLLPKIAISSLLPLSSLSSMLSKVWPQILKVILVDGNTSEEIVLKKPSSDLEHMLLKRMIITLSDLKQVFTTTFKAQSQWQNILLGLQVSRATIESIKAKYQDNSVRCYHQGLKEWLEGGERSWGDLVEALSSPAVGHSDIAMVIERDFLQFPEIRAGAMLEGKQEGDKKTTQADPPQELKPPLTLKWRRGKDMPIFMIGTVQSVVIGDSVYVGGGDAASDHDSRTVMKFDLQRDEWTKLPQYSAKYFAMTSFADQLVLVGGRDSVTRALSRKVAVYLSGRWSYLLPPMNIAQSRPTAVCFKSYIIVVGGEFSLSVEVLDVTSRIWYNAESLTTPHFTLKSTLIGNTLYLMGAMLYTSPFATTVVHKVDLIELITKALSKQATPTLWQTIEDIPHYDSAPLNVRGSLLAVGGHDEQPVSSILLYQPDTRRWVKVGDLPTAQYNCTCSVLPNGEVIVAGGFNAANFLSISNAN